MAISLWVIMGGLVLVSRDYHWNSIAYHPFSRFITYFRLHFTTSDMRRDVQEIFRATPHHKQVMMFSATLSKDIRNTCKKFMQSVSGRSRSVLTPASRDLRRRRDQAYIARSSTVLPQARGEGEEPQAQRPFGRPRVQPGLYLCEVGFACYSARRASPGVQLPFHLHSLWLAPGRAVSTTLSA